MKAGCLALLGAIVVVLALGALVFLRSVRPLPPEEEPPPPQDRPRPPQTVPTPSPLPDRYLGHVRSLNRFSRSEAGGRYTLSYGFIDHHGRTHDVSCTISMRDHEEELAWFGYDEVELRAAADAKLRAYLAGELAARGLTSYVTVKVSKGSISADSSLPGSLGVEEHNRLNREIKRFYKLWDDGSLDAVRERAETALYQERGFALEKNHIRIDYSRVALRSRRALNDCFQALEQAGAGYNARQFLGLVLAFFQEIRYEVPPDRIDGRKVLGFWVPTEVLVNDHGDCDSKSVAFAAMWRALDAGLVFLRVPGHVLVGVEVKPGPGEKYAVIKNRYYVFCEVAGPGKFYPGEKEVTGSFQYFLLEPSG